MFGYDFYFHRYLVLELESRFGILELDVMHDASFQIPHLIANVATVIVHQVLIYPSPL
jgi:hypothetical protein